MGEGVFELWTVGERFRIGVHWPVAPTVTITRQNGATLEYRQDDDTWGATPASRVMPVESVGVYAYKRAVVPADVGPSISIVCEAPGLRAISAGARAFVTLEDLEAEDFDINALGVLTIKDAVDHTTVLGTWQLYDKTGAIAPWGKSAVRRIRL